MTIPETEHDPIQITPIRTAFSLYESQMSPPHLGQGFEHLSHGRLTARLVLRRVRVRRGSGTGLSPNLIAATPLWSQRCRLPGQSSLCVSAGAHSTAGQSTGSAKYCLTVLGKGRSRTLPCPLAGETTLPKETALDNCQSD